MGKITQEYIDQNRRDFINKVINKSVGGSLMLMIPMSSNLFSEVISEDEEFAGKLSKKFKNAGVDPSKQYCFMVDVTACIGCGACCVADRRENDVPEGMYRTWVERYIIDIYNTVYVDSPQGGEEGYSNHPRDDIKHDIKDAFFVPKLCNMCDEPSCTQVCPVAATFTTPDGFVIVDPDHCVACGYCIQACPYGVRFINPKTKTADKCTWCYHRVTKGKLPACVNACPTGARKFGDLNDPDSEVAKIYHDSTRLTVLKKDIGNEPTLYYINSHPEVV